MPNKDYVITDGSFTRHDGSQAVVGETITLPDDVAARHARRLAPVSPVVSAKVTRKTSEAASDG